MKQNVRKSVYVLTRGLPLKDIKIRVFLGIHFYPMGMERCADAVRILSVAERLKAFMGGVGRQSCWTEFRDCHFRGTI